MCSKHHLFFSFLFFIFCWITNTIFVQYHRQHLNQPFFDNTILVISITFNDHVPCAPSFQLTFWLVWCIIDSLLINFLSSHLYLSPSSHVTHTTPLICSLSTSMIFIVFIIQASIIMCIQPSFSLLFTLPFIGSNLVY